MKWIFESGITINYCCETRKREAEEETAWGYMVKKISAYGECLGSKRRRKTWQPAKSPGELATSDEPRISEWGNPLREILTS